MRAVSTQRVVVVYHFRILVCNNCDEVIGVPGHNSHPVNISGRNGLGHRLEVRVDNHLRIYLRMITSLAFSVPQASYRDGDDKGDMKEVRVV